MARRVERFDRYLERMAEGLSTDLFTCSAVIPDVDGGLIFALQDRAGKQRGVKLEYESKNRFERRPRFLRGKNSLAIIRTLEHGFARFVSTRRPHPLLDFVGQDIREIILRKGVELQEVWSRHLEEGKTRWTSWVLEKIELRAGAMYLVFRDGERSVVVRISDREDPRLDRSDKVLLINNLALSLVEDSRKGKIQPFDQVERFVAYLMAHTTGPSTRIRGYSETTPSVTLYGKEVRINPFLPEGRQGASGMAAALFGRNRKKLKIVSFGDASCRQTFPPFSALRFFDTWSYFPVKMAPAKGSWAAFDFSEKEVVGGSEKKLKHLVQALKRQDRDVKVALVQTCVSRLIGDDVRGVLRGVLEDDDFVILDPDFQARDAAVDSQVWPWALKAFRPGGKKTRRGNLINLVGLGHREFRATGELEAMLERLGVGLNASLFPSFTEEELESFDAARVTVASTCSIVRHAFTLAAEEDPVNRWVFLDPPFGLRQTRSWAAAVLSEVKRGKELEEATARLGQMYREFSKKLGPLKQALCGTSVALVASSRFSAYMFAPSETFGIPVIDFLTELGLDVEMFVYNDIAPSRDLLQAARKRDNVTLDVHDDPDELLDAVQGSRSKLMLTSVRRNGSALAMGKVPVFVHAFEMGFDGALRTAERFARYFSFDFVDRYRGYFRS